ncbi:MAG: HlyD family secretion protein [Phycisphaerae bacterium]
MSEPVVKPRRKALKIILAIAILLALGSGVFGYWYFYMRGIVFSDDARFGGHLVDLAPEISTRLLEVNVHEGQRIHKGDVIFRLDSSTLESALAQAQEAAKSAQAGLAVAKARHERAVNGPRQEEIKACEAVAVKLQTEEKLAETEFGRAKSLFARNVATQDELDRAESAFKAARHAREQADQNLALLRAGTRKEDVQAAAAEVDRAAGRLKEAEAAVARARLDVDRTVIAAPFDGWVVRRWLDPGSMPLPGQPVVSVFDPTTLRVDANIEEKYLHRVVVGDTVDISVDSYPDLRLQGRVVEILRAANSKFSLVPSEGVSGTFIKVTQRVPLRIAVSAPPDLPLGPGLSVEVRIHSGSGQSSRPEVADPKRDASGLGTLARP